MDFKGKWLGHPFKGEHGWLVQLELQHLPTIYEKTKDDILHVTIEKFREKRSLDANAYFHKLCSLIAKEMTLSQLEVKNQMISDYGYIDEDIGCIIMRNDIDWRKNDRLHLSPTAATRVLDDGNLYRVYHVMRGSHTYNTKEMSVLIDGTVQEAKQLGIETMPENELRRMVELWKVY